MPVKKTRILAAEMAVLGSFAVVGSSNAEAITPGQAVTTAHAGSQVGWRTPAVAAAHAKITNTSSMAGAQTLITLKDSSAPTSYEFPLTIPNGATLTPTTDGGYDIVTNKAGFGYAIGHVDAPWAKDADGRSIPTSFTLNGTTLTQHVDARGAQYPITADPHYTWGWVTGTVYFNKSETAKAAASGAFIAALGAFAPPPFASFL